MASPRLVRRHADFGVKALAVARRCRPSPRAHRQIARWAYYVTLAVPLDELTYQQYARCCPDLQPL